VVAALDGIRVVERTTGIAGAYCTKLLRDAGASVTKVEPAGGDPLRGWRAGALFEFLNDGKALADDAGDADLVVDTAVSDGPIVVTITPFGVDGPWAGRPATEFTLQAACGSIGSRGLPEGRPLAAGGRIGEWMTGTYAAVAAAAALRAGGPAHVDVAMLDCMAVSLVTYPSAFAEFQGWPPLVGTGRAVEVPSILRTSDGWVNVTTNSATQFQDLLVMIERTDWLDDPDLPNVAKRFARRDEFLAACEAWTSVRTTEEVLAAASDFRIPSGPVLEGADVPAFEQFVARGALPGGRPRVPYRMTPPAGGAKPHAGGLPLEGIRVLDLTAWWAGPAATHVLAALGADVVKVESPSRPDLMRYSSVKPPSEDRWWEWGPLFHSVNAGKRAVSLDLGDPAGKDAFERLVRTADLVVENFTPRVMDQFGLGWDRISELNPACVLLRMPAFGLDGPWRDRTGFAQTMESVTGMAAVTGEEDGPPVLVRGAPDPLAGMHAVFAALVALADGGGCLVESTMVEAALNAAADGILEPGLTRIGNRAADGSFQEVFRCAGDDTWVAIGADPGLDDVAAWCAARSPEEVVDELQGRGVPAEVVIPGRDIARNPQLRHRGLFEVEDHPVTGSHELPAMPFRFAGVDRWNRRAAPTIGQHNHEVLLEVLSEDELADLYARGVAGERVTGL
jgi:crotonobetainyl-CoA:carnitine CoA-transferase CaiB-like acyl-CoA transferase